MSPSRPRRRSDDPRSARRWASQTRRRTGGPVTTQPRRSTLVSTLALSFVIAACGSDETSTAGESAESTTPGAASAPTASVPESTVDGSPSPAGTTPDGCALLTPAEVTAVIGTARGDSTNSSSGDFGCNWENTDTSHSISLQIGSPGTAANRTLPAVSDYGPTEPGPDGIRFAPGNVAEFIIEDLTAEMSVITSLTDDKDRPTANRLIGLVRGRL